ncbi:MAG TPA: DsbA family oxidoreductase [Gemmatimonadales bacterium]|nr:DsbA family oxidoreductase [Gemmatimonadales bacterium]
MNSAASDLLAEERGAARMKVEIYSDIACPWCYIGERRFKRALAAFEGAEGVEVVFRPYQLDPATPGTAQPLVDYLSRRFGGPAEGMLSQVTSVASGEGITMNWKHALSANTHTAHRLSRLAELEYGSETQARLMELLFNAHFTRGMDVGDKDVLTGLAVAAGMDEARVTEYLATDEGAGELDDALQHARNIGVTAVPTFVFNGELAVQGAQPASTFLQALEEAQRQAGAVGESLPADDEGEGVNCADATCSV